MHQAATPLTHTKETIRTHKALGAQDQQMKALETFKRAKHANEAHSPPPPPHTHILMCLHQKSVNKENHAIQPLPVKKVGVFCKKM